ncbi:hypothetical protein DC498_12780 [Terrimonas sp.]|uniref:ligand-binding sensor domain-containing protein n=1 Tax=Terrimonas sp. TaxID=1914338 RepID=UPI000D5182E8|nr:two-component regulator propeller domain-containing protein [Terrimonas sp.]PVD51914.1 hypothetical protein DC498_12780 [Terrimonas sp.]
MKLFSLHTLNRLIFLLCITAGAKAQSDELRVSAYTEADGLSSNIVRCVLQDSRGVLWAGTPDGLNYYDGYTFNTFRKSSTDSSTIRSNFITKLAEDQVGDIWIGYLSGGVSCYNITTGKFRHYPLKTYTKSDHIKSGEVTMLFINRKNEVWIGVARQGMFKLDKHTGEYTRYNLADEKGIAFTADAVKAYNTVFGAYEDPSGALWLATAAGLYYFQPATNSMKQLRETPLRESAENRDLFLCIARQGDKLWLGAWAGGMACYDMVKNEWKHFPYDYYSPTTNIIIDIRLLPGDSILFISNDKGLGYFNKNTGSFSFAGNDDLIKTGDYKSVYQDKADNIWIASDRGLIKIWRTSKKFSFHALNTNVSMNGGYHRVNVAFENDHFLMLGTSYSDGLHIKNKHNGKQYTLAFETLPGEENFLLVTDIIQDSEGIIWVLTRDYIYQLDTTAMKLRKISSPSSVEKKGNYFIRIQEDISGVLWIASLRNGLFAYNKKDNRFTHHYTSDKQGMEYIPTRYISALHSSKDGTLWIGGGNGFLGKLNITSGIVQTYATYFPKEDINANTVFDIVTDDSLSLWVGTDAGLLQYQVREGNAVFKQVFTSENGISSDFVKGVAKAEDGNIWCVTQLSLCRLNPCTGVIANYGYSDGLENPEISSKIQTLYDGQMAVGTIKGYYTFSPAYLSQLRETAPILVTSFNVNGRQRYYGNELARNGKVVLDPSEKMFAFEFASIDFNRTSKQQYAYMLEGIDTGWTTTYNRYAGYSNLKAGNYIFKVRAVGNTHKLDSEAIAVPIYISGYFYTMWWFWLMVAVAAFAVMYFIYKLRLRNQRRVYELNSRAGKLEKEKAMIMYESLKQQLNPHFLFNSLTSLGSLIRSDQELAEEFLDGLSRIYRYILNNRNKELVSLLNEIRFSETYIKLQKTRFGDALQVNIKVEEAFHYNKIAPVTLQNLLENAIKHNIVTGEEPLVIDIYVNETNQLVVKNNLNKKTFVETSNGQGLANLSSLYNYLSEKEIVVKETAEHFWVSIPLL